MIITLQPLQSSAIVSGASQTTTTTKTITYNFVTADGIPVMWQSTDIEILVLLGQTTLSSSTLPTTTALPSRATTLISVTTSAYPSPGLSTGAKIGIGVSIPLAVIAVLVGALITCFRRRSRREDPANEEYQDMPELYGTATQHDMANRFFTSPATNPSELDSRGIQKGLVASQRTDEQSQQPHPIMVEDSQYPTPPWSNIPATTQTGGPVSANQSSRESMRTSMHSPPPIIPPKSIPSPTHPATTLQSLTPSVADAPNLAELQDDAEMAAIEEAMERLEARKQRIRELEDIEAQEAEIEARRKEIKRAREAKNKASS